MKTVFSSQKECAHIWAQQSQPFGKASNLFFERSRIYSYGTHYCIANFVNDNVVLINSKNYSHSTNKHSTYVRRALNESIKVINVPFVQYPDHIGNIEFFKNKINNLINEARKSVKYTEFSINQANYYKGQALDYCDVFNLPRSTKEYFNSLNLIDEQINSKIEAQREKRELKEQIERIENEQLIEFCKNEVLPAWFNNLPLPKLIRQSGKNVVYKNVDPYILPFAYLRVNENEVETTHGAKVPLDAAKVLFSLIQSGRDIKGFKIGNYTVIGINGVLTIGCHKIERNEIERFAKTQNWI
jgi:hypothetical protein